MDSLADSIGRGIGQYVMLGAGLDSFACRSRLASRVRVFEIDDPATQEWKRRIGPVPEIVTFVPVDFTRDSLRPADLSRIAHGRIADGRI